MNTDEFFNGNYCKHCVGNRDEHTSSCDVPEKLKEMEDQ